MADIVISLIAEVIELVDLVSELVVGVMDRVLDIAVQDLALVRVLLVLLVNEYIKVHVPWYQELASGVGSLDILPELVLIMVFSQPMPKDFHPQ